MQQRAHSSRLRGRHLCRCTSSTMSVVRVPRSRGLTTHTDCYSYDWRRWSILRLSVSSGSERRVFSGPSNRDERGRDRAERHPRISFASHHGNLPDCVHRRAFAVSLPASYSPGCSSCSRRGASPTLLRRLSGSDGLGRRVACTIRARLTGRSHRAQAPEIRTRLQICRRVSKPGRMFRRKAARTASTVHHCGAIERVYSQLSTAAATTRNIHADGRQPGSKALPQFCAFLDRVHYPRIITGLRF